MIVEFKNRRPTYFELFDIVCSCNDDDFYLTENNQRLHIRSFKHLRKLLRNSHDIYYVNTLRNQGIVLVWKGFGGDKSRQYVKLIADQVSTARDLLTVLFWNYNRDVFIKVKKQSMLTPALREKGFRFVGGRGSEILLSRTRFSRE
jgi:hypothetical protein